MRSDSSKTKTTRESDKLLTTLPSLLNPGFRAAFAELGRPILEREGTPPCRFPPMAMCSKPIQGEICDKAFRLFWTNNDGLCP